VPIDWFLGFDTFSLYTFLNLVGFGTHGAGGYLTTYLREETRGFTIDFRRDFEVMGHSKDGLVRHLWTKFWLVVDTLKNLCIVMCCVVAICKTLIYSLSKNHLRYEVEEFFTPMQEQQRRLDARRAFRNNDGIPFVLPNLNTYHSKGLSITMIVTFHLAVSLFFLLMLSLNDYPNPTGLYYIVYASTISYLIGTLVLKHTSKRRSFFFSVMRYSFLFYLYGRVYFLSSTQCVATFLPKLTYLLYLTVALLNNLKKFSIDFDQF